MADFIKTNEIQTRISLKYDSYSNWSSKNPVLLKGEVAIATIPQNTANTFPNENLPNVVMKVGDGTSQYNALPFVSALAADVYEWAKAATKPSYAISEISNALEYRLATMDDTNHKYALQARKAGSEEDWKNVADSSIDLSALVADVADHETRIDTIEGDLNTAETGLKARMTAAEAAIEGITSAGGAIGSAINEKIQTLDANLSETVGGLTVSLTQVDGVVTAIEGSIAAETYDAYGAAAAVKEELTEGAIKTNAEAIDVIEGKDAGKSMREVAVSVVESLDYNAYEAGFATGKTISFVGSVQEDNGVISAEKRDLVFTDAYAESNPAATKKYVDDAVLNGVADLTGAMHFEGVKNELPKLTGEHGYVNGDVIIVGVTEYVYSNGAWVQLGDEGALAAALQALSLGVTGDVDKTLVISQTNGKVNAEAKSIQIAQSQVTGLTDDLNAKLAADTFNTFKEDEFTPVKNSVDTLKGDANKAGSVAHSINTAVANLKNTDAAVDGEYVKAVTQSNGIVTVERAKLPVIPNLAITHATSTTTPTDAEVTVVGDISASGHTITDTHVKVATKAGVNAAIAALSTTVAAEDKKVLTGLTQTNGVVSATKATLADIAFSGKVDDLKQDTNTYIVFNCGTSEINI